MVVTLVIWAAVMGGGTGYYCCWRWGKGRVRENRDVELIRALGEVVAKANGTYGSQQPTNVEVQPEIWYSDMQDEVDPYMENENADA